MVESAALIVAKAHFYDGLDFLVSFVQALARNALLEEANNGVLVTGTA